MKLLKIIIIGIVFFYLQVYINHFFSSSKVFLSLLLPLVFYISVKYKNSTALLLTFFFSLLFDLLSPMNYGLDTMVLLVIAEIVNKNYVYIRVNKIFLFIGTIILTIVIYYSTFLLYDLIYFQKINFMNYFFSILYNTFFFLIVFLMLELVFHLKTEIDAK